MSENSTSAIPSKSSAIMAAITGAAWPIARIVTVFIAGLLPQAFPDQDKLFGYVMGTLVAVGVILYRLAKEWRKHHGLH